MKYGPLISLVLVGSVCWPVAAAAQGGPYVEATVRTSLAAPRGPAGRTWPIIGGERAVPVTLTLERTATAEALDALEALPGVSLRWVEGRPLHRGRLVPVLATEAGVRWLAAQNNLRRVSAGIDGGLVPPLDHTTALVGMEAARRTWVGEHSLTGEGMVLADIDSSIEIFHPDFFAADGGAYDWLDVDGNGTFDPRTDAVDLDGDGEADEDEIGAVLQAVPTDFSTTLPVRPEGFSAGWDWIYVDVNGNGRRDFGPEQGFDDSTPGFGEPLFIVDDIDGDDQLGRDERLLRLSTSRVRSVYVAYPSGWVNIFRRGVDLIDLPYAPFGEGAYGMPEAMHATSVVSIAAGGVPHAGRPLTGFAPEAELLVAYDGARDNVSALIWALDEGADVVLHEYASWVGVTLDGSDALSEAIDDSTTDDGVVHVCPVGNTGGSRKHTMATLAADESATLSLEVPTADNYYYLGLSFHWLPGEADLAIALVTPGGDRLELSELDGEISIDGRTAWLSPEMSAAGTAMLHLDVWDRRPVPVGLWQFEVTNVSVEEATIHGYVRDEVSGWGLGIAWAAPIATDVSNICLPSTAERCLAVGAHTGHEATEGDWFRWPEVAGEVRTYSGRGPRIDGLQKPDIVAPDNPFAAFPRWPEYEVDLGAYWVFGGTSGAGPHVAGAALLLAQTEPERGGEEVIEMLLAGAVADDITGEVPNFDYGHGRVSLAGALGVEVGGEPPRVELDAPERAEPGDEIEVVPTVEDPDGDGDLAEIRWDVGYDGAWDGDFGPVADLAVEIPLDAIGAYAVKVQARDETGLIGQGVAWVTVDVDPGDAGADADTSGADADLPDGDVDADAGGEEPVFGAAGGRCDCRASGGGEARFAGLVRLLAAWL